MARGGHRRQIPCRAGPRARRSRESAGGGEVPASHRAAGCAAAPEAARPEPPAAAHRAPGHLGRRGGTGAGAPLTKSRQAHRHRWLSRGRVPRSRAVAIRHALLGHRAALPGSGSKIGGGCGSASRGCDGAAPLVLEVPARVTERGLLPQDGPHERAARFGRPSRSGTGRGSWLRCLPELDVHVWNSRSPAPQPDDGGRVSQLSLGSVRFHDDPRALLLALRPRESGRARAPFGTLRPHARTRRLRRAVLTGRGPYRPAALLCSDVDRLHPGRRARAVGA